MSIRVQRVATLLKREIADIFARELPPELLVTVTGARVTKDLGIVYVDVAVMADALEQRQQVFIELQAYRSHIRGVLGRRIRHQLRRVPEVRFFLDESQEHASKMETLFDTIRQERSQRENS